MIYAVLVLIIIGLLFLVRKYLRLYLFELDEAIKYLDNSLLRLGTIINLRTAIYFLFFESEDATLLDMNFWQEVQDESERLFNDHISFEAYLLERIEVYKKALADKARRSDDEQAADSYYENQAFIDYMTDEQQETN